MPLATQASIGLPLLGYDTFISPQGCETNTLKEGGACLLEMGMSWCGFEGDVCQVEPTINCSDQIATNGYYKFSCNSCNCQLECNDGYSLCSENSTCVPDVFCSPGVFDPCSNTCISTKSTGLGFFKDKPFFF